MKISHRFELIRPDLSKWLQNQKIFLAPLGMFYVGSVIALASDGIGWNDFVPGNEVITAMSLYVLNALFDLFRKWSGESRYR